MYQGEDGFEPTSKRLRLNNRLPPVITSTRNNYRPTSPINKTVDVQLIEYRL